MKLTINTHCMSQMRSHKIYSHSISSISLFKTVYNSDFRPLQLYGDKFVEDDEEMD